MAAGTAPIARVLIANERHERLQLLAGLVAGLGYLVVGPEVELSTIAAVTTREQPHVAVVGLGASSQHALDMIREIAREAVCPVIAVWAKDRAYVREAAKRGAFASIVDDDPEDLARAIDVTLYRFAEYQNLQEAFDRRAVIEQAKGILMARHGVSPDRAFEMLRAHSQQGGQKLADIARAVVDSHQLLVRSSAGSGSAEPRGT
jgi:AmiR/NasT family two-component response regulator